jgi:hypothetical protein
LGVSRYQGWAFFWQALATGAAFIAASFAAWAAYRAFQSAEDTLEHARDSRAEARSGERAWVLPESPAIGINFLPPMHFEISIVWKNCGRTPAIDFRFSPGGLVYYEYDIRDSPYPIAIGPGQTTATSVIIRVPAAEAYQDRLMYPFRCKVTYRDIFSNVERHSEAAFAFQYLGQTNPTVVTPFDPRRQMVEAGVNVIDRSRSAD